MPQQPSRAERRQGQRTGAGAPPKQRDPMMAVYIGVAVLLAVVIGGFALFRWNQQHAYDVAYSSPSPAPTTSGGPTPIPLQDGGSIGKPVIKLYAHNLPDTPEGGHGQPLDGITCMTTEGVVLHVHPHLSIFRNGTQIQIPRNIGIAPSGGGGCLYWVHTHDQTGIIHVEAPQLAPEGGSGYTLGILFDIWGQPLDRNDVAGIKGPVTAFLNGQKYDGDLRSIELKAHNQIVLDVGTPTPDPQYLFPPNE